MNKFFRYVKYSSIYSLEILLPAVFIFFILSIYPGFSSAGFVLFSALFILFMILIFYLIGKKKNSTEKQIIGLINAIRNNEIASVDEIKLGRNFHELENEIKETFIKVRNDLNNMQKLEIARTEFLGNVSHELRTPIFAIQGFIETLLDGAINDPKVNKKFLEKALRHTAHLNDLLNDLINISMIESGQMSMSFRYFAINEYLGELLKEFLPAAERKNLTLRLSEINPLLKVFGDKDRLRQVFRNLISNAIKYTDSGEVSIELADEQKFLRFTVSDTGIGIPEKEISRIFERFYRTESGKLKSAEGTGLGLAIVKHILEAHQTKIEVESEYGKGSKFSFRLKK